MTEHTGMDASTYVALQGLEAAPLENGAVLYHPQTKKFIMLNRSAAMIWGELATPKTREQLISKVCAVYPDVDEGSAVNDVTAALEQLKSLELVSGSN
jgi:hypothetical protein